MRATLVIVMLVVGGCGGPPECVLCPDGSTVRLDAGPRDAGPDASRRDGGRDASADAGTCALVPGRSAGAPCFVDGVCEPGLECRPEERSPGTGAGDCTSADDHVVSAGGMCARACEPDADDGGGCSDCERCSDFVLYGRVRFAAAPTCRPRCTPTLVDRGGCREGYACDPFSRTCLDACTSDAECEWSIGWDGDLACRPGSAVCDRATGRCRGLGTGAAPIGGACVADSECEADGTCLGLPGGYCTRVGCLGPGLECDGADEVCDVVAFAITSACLEACTIGAEETVEQRRGSAGGNPTCSRPGYACAWSGTGELGSCLPGNYNDEPAYDVGTTCLDDADCFSPFGYGRCLFTNVLDRVATGICAIAGCAGGTGGAPIGLLAGPSTTVALDPSVASELCDVAAGDACLGLGDGKTFCMTTCTDASECPAGYACAAVLAGGARLCWPNCNADADCHVGASCRNTTGGACATGQECYCTDATPADADGGTPDAG